VFGSAVTPLRTLSRLSSPSDDSISRVRCHAWPSPTLSLLYIFSLLLLRQDVYRSVFVDCVQTIKNQYGDQRSGRDTEPPRYEREGAKDSSRQSSILFAIQCKHSISCSHKATRTDERPLCSHRMPYGGYLKPGAPEVFPL
jgi:hypothetical protein